VESYKLSYSKCSEKITLNIMPSTLFKSPQ
jgi:hypothetical protein